MPHLRRSLHSLITPRWTRPGIVSAVAVAGLLMLAAAPAHAWDARTLEGTAAERSNTTTPTNMAKDQCSLKVPDIVSGVYNFSWACYAHDVCYQNHQLNGTLRSRETCDGIFKAKMDAECLARHGSGTRLGLKPCRGFALGYWEGIRAAGDPSWRSWNGRQCVDVSAGSAGDGAAVIQYHCNWGENQRFTFPSIDATGELRPRHASGKCLDVSGADRGDGAKVILYACNGGANQRFTRTRSGELRAQHSGKCLDVSGASRSDGAAIIQYRCNGGANQRFRFTARGELRPAHR